MLKDWQIVLLANLYGLDISRCQLVFNCGIGYGKKMAKPKYVSWIEIEWLIPGRSKLNLKTY